MDPDISEIASCFEFDGEVSDVQPHHSGHINDTYIVRNLLPKGIVRRYILQRINRFVFRTPRDLMQNIETVTQHLRQKVIQEGGDPRRETPEVIATTSGDIMLERSDGECWRAYTYIEGTCVAQGETHLYQAAWAFAKFQKRLSDLPINSVIDILPGFHDTKARLMAFVKATESDSENRASGARNEIDFVQKRADQIFGLTDLLNRKTFTTQVIHNDTKLDNVLIDKQTEKALCVIDLDTVMPGLPHYDFGDCVRSGASSATEDERNLSRVFLDMNRFKLLASGYLKIARTFLNPTEREYLPTSAWLITFECGIRFLTDYLLGDRYFKIHRKKHNLDRCRTHFTLLTDIERKIEPMASLVEKLAQS